MKHLSSLFATFALVSAVACGGSNPPPASPAETTGAKESGHEHKEGADHDKHHEGLSPALKDFHGVIAPVWHSDKGAVRTEKACTNVKPMQEKAQATGDAELIAAVAALEPACAASGRSEVEAKLHVVHERFHALAEPKK